MPVSLKYPTLGKNLGKTLKKLAKTKQKTVKKQETNISRLLEGGGPSQDSLENQKKIQKTLEKQKNKRNQKTIFLDSLEGGGPSQDSLKIVFFCFFGFFGFFGCSNVFLVFLVFQGFCRFFGFGHFQPSAPFCTLAVRCLHAFKLAGTNRLTTAAMNILGLRIKTVCSNFEMFGHVLDNNLSFMLYFLKKHVA